jgi:hypothetical protein
VASEALREVTVRTPRMCIRFGTGWGAAVALLAVLGACHPPPAYRPLVGPAATGGDRASALAPLTAREQALCTEIATRREFKETLGEDRYAVLSQVPVYRRYGTSFPRTCKIELFDYPKNLDLQAMIELATAKVISSRQVKDLQPAVGASEIAVARGIAESSAEAKGSRLQAIFLRPLEDLQVTAMVRTDTQQCRTHRCVELDFYEKGPATGNTPAAEPTNVQVPWHPITPLARVVVDLSQIAVHSLEVF